MRIITIILLGLLVRGASAHASLSDFYITPDSSLTKTIQKARELKRLGQATAVTIHLGAGTYQLYEPLRLRPEDSGLTILGKNAVISGGIEIRNWRKEGKLLVADVPDFNGRPIDFRQLWVNGKKAIRARDVSDFEQMHRIMTYDKKKQVLWVPKEAVVNILKAPYAEMVLHEMWCTSNLRIRSITIQGDSAAVRFHNPEADIQFKHPWPSPMTPNTGHPSPFYLTNAKELLDEPGEWYHDIREHKLYYMPQENEKEMVNSKKFIAVVPVLETLVEFIGSAEHPVRNITIKGVTFSHTTWMRPSEKGHVPLQAGMYLTEAYKLRPSIDRTNNHKLDNQGWLGRADAAVELRYTENVNFDGCRFEHLGGSGLDYVIACRRGSTTKCIFTDIAMNGYVCGSFSPNGLETHLPYHPTDFREICSGQAVEQSEFYNVTNEDWGCVAIAAGYVSGITIEHNTIHDISYTGISLGWGWNRDLICMKNNRVHANLIYNYAQHMYDCAGIYTLGNQPGTVISENVVRDIAKPSYVHDPNHWFYLYTDEGSSNITIRNNWTPEEKFLQNANGPCNIWENNGPQVNENIKQNAGINKMKTSNAIQVSANSQKSTWIWYPGDFEIWLGNIFNNRRTERGAMFPPFWKQDSHYVTVEFSREFNLEHEETITIACEGQFNLALDGKLQFGQPKSFVVRAGKHKLNIKVWNQATPPALFIEGATICTDSTWLATYEDKIWIDENGAAHGSGIYVPAASWNFNNIETPPSQYRLERSEQRPVYQYNIATNATLYDFGQETFGFLKIKNLQGLIHIYYGESREEALDKEYCETLDVLSSPICRDIIATSKAFRFVYIEAEEGTTFDEVLMDYEFAPINMDRTGAFRCSDEEINHIWNVAAYTMDLTTREFFMDGIKRDRWTWSGDAIQSYLMNYYLRFDTECVKRTIRQLRGKDPVTAHVNTIMDYTFYWFKSIYDYYLYTADKDFVREMWPRMVTLMEYVEGRLNSDGMAEGQPDDWIFVDWVDFPMHKRGTLCFEQILLMKAMETMGECAKLLGINKTDYREKSEALRNRIKQTFWNDEKKAYYHAIEEGQMNKQITKFPNMFAILYGLAHEEQRKEIMQSVMLNPDIDPITTPYMRFYELETLCMDGLQTQVLQEIRDYWGGMLREGATSFWEKYNPEEKGAQHFAMYGRPYGKSLCHAWGASPVYLIGKYYLGVQPTKPGYEEYIVKPDLGDLQWMEGDVPTPFGKIHVAMNKYEVTIYSDGGHGILIIGEKTIEIPAKQEIIIAL